MEINKQGINSIVSDNLIRLREMHGMSKKDVAMALGVKPNTYRVWESVDGKNGVKNYYLLQLAKIYNVSVDYLLHPHGESNEATDDSSVSSLAQPDNKSVYGDNHITELSDAERIHLMQLRRLSSNDKKKVSELIGTLLDEMDRFNGITEEDK